MVIEIINEIINSIVSLVIVFINISMFRALYKHKKIRSKEENLFLEKTFFNIICFIYCIFLSLSLIYGFFDRDKIVFKIQIYIFNVYIILLYLVNFFISLELYFTYKTPFYFFLIIFNQKSRKIYEFILLCFLLGILSFHFFGPEKEFIYDIIKDKLSTPLFLLDRWKWIFLLLINIITLFYNFRLYLFISDFYFMKKYKLKKLIRNKIISNCFYFLYGLFHLYNLLSFDYLREKFDLSPINYKLATEISSYLILVITLIDNIIELSIISTTRFSLYKLRKTFVGHISCLFPNDFGKDEILEEDITDMDYYESETDEEIYMAEEETEMSLVAKCFEDNELVSIFKNNIYFEDYFLHFFDQFLNILTASLFKMYNSKLFSTAIIKDQKLKEEIDVSCSSIGPGTSSIINHDYSESIIMEENSNTFNFHKKRKKDPFHLFKDILGNNNDDINVKISTYYTKQCVYNIINSNLVSKQIASSLVSHFIMNKKEKNENQNKYWSLTAANAKDEYFKNIKNISFRSYDRNINLDLFITNDEDISLSNKSNKNIAKMIQRYFNYIQNGKGQTGSFLPIVIGIFKVKINDFSTILVYMSRNILAQNVPKQLFSYWQLVKFDSEKPNKITSSKLNRRTLVKDEPLFERVLSIEKKKENPDLNKIILKNFSDFKEVLSNDIKFLKNNDLSYVNLLMMYYEYELTKEREKGGGTIKIRKVNSNKAEIIQINNPKRVGFDDDEDKDEMKKININEEFGSLFNNKNDKLLNALDVDKEDEIFGDEEFDFKPEIKKNYVNLLDYSEKVNINGYEGNFDKYNCMCFFTFENLFDTRKKFNMTSQPYTLFEKKILDYFANFNFNT